MTVRMVRTVWAAVGMLGVAGLLSVLGTGASASNPQPDGRISQAESVAVEGAVDRRGTHGVPAGRARAAAATAAARIPLPVGGNFNGIQWEAAGGLFSESEIEAALEYNAMCQWLRAVRDGRDPDTSLRVLRLIVSWPALRETPAGDFVSQVAAEARQGSGPAYEGALADCDASQARQAEHSKNLGLTPSS